MLRYVLCHVADIAGKHNKATSVTGMVKTLPAVGRTGAFLSGEEGGSQCNS